MNEDDKPAGSLADQAASWVPPWARPKPEPAAAQSFPELQWQSDEPAGEDSPSASELSPSSEPSPEAEGEIEPEAEIEPVAAEPEPEAEVRAVVAEPEPEVQPELEPELESVAEVEPVVAEPEGEAVADTLPGLEAPAPEAAAEPVKPEMGDAELRGAVEAILLVVDEPTSEVTLAQVLDQPVERVVGALEAASAEYTRLGFGFDLRRVAGGWRLYTRPEYAAYVEKFVLDGQQIRLTQAALETLAVIAYKQPVTRSRISAIRGVNCDGVVRTLVTRGLIEEIGSEPESGAFLYKTTTLFLEKLGLDSVEQLPPLAPFLPDDIDEIADAQR
nr:hypothetical protein GCM10020063_111690 [Dactylosporangium thailandense]